MQPPVKPLLSGYKLIVGYVLGGMVITATVIVGLKWNTWFKPKTTTPAPTQSVPVQTDPLAQYNGDYAGSASVSEGITTAKVNVINGKITGTANYAGGGTAVAVTIAGTVDINGNFTGTLTGTGSDAEGSAGVSGTFTGKIVSDSFNANYSGSGGGQSASGLIVLIKK